MKTRLRRLHVKQHVNPDGKDMSEANEIWIERQSQIQVQSCLAGFSSCVWSAVQLVQAASDLLLCTMVETTDVTLSCQFVNSPGILMKCR